MSEYDPSAGLTDSPASSEVDDYDMGYLDGVHDAHAKPSMVCSLCGPSSSEVEAPTLHAMMREFLVDQSAPELMVAEFDRLITVPTAEDAISRSEAVRVIVEHQQKELCEENCWTAIKRDIARLPALPVAGTVGDEPFECPWCKVHPHLNPCSESCRQARAAKVQPAAALSAGERVRKVADEIVDTYSESLWGHGDDIATIIANHLPVTPAEEMKQKMMEKIQAVGCANDLQDGGFFEAGFIAAKTAIIDALLQQVEVE